MTKEKYIKKEGQTAVNVTQTKIDSIRKKDILKTGIRMHDKDIVGVAGVLGEYKESELENRAKESLKDKIPYPFKVSIDRKIEEIRVNKYLMNSEELVDEMEKLLDYFRKEYSEFSFMGKGYIGEYEERLLNDRKLDLRYVTNYFSLGFGFKEKSSANIIDGDIGYMGKKYDKDSFLNFTDNLFGAYRNQVDLPKEGKYPVIFSTSDFMIMIKLIKDLHGLMFGSGGSMLSDKLGKKVFSDKFTVLQSLNPDEFIPFFDAEGTVNENYEYELIKNGEIISPYTDKKISKMFNLPLTGSATAEYDGVPNINYIRLKIAESEKTAKELLGGDKGIFVIVASGGDFTDDGNFASPVQLAMFYDGEKFTGRLPEIQISSSLFDMYGDDFRGVSKNPIIPNTLDKHLIMDMNVSKI
ncbi:MAG: metallopeptidase TldD-related protein [Spirochaetota bacterium]